MSEKRFEFYSDEDLIGVLDTVTGRTFNSFEIVDCLNEQQATIESLKKDLKIWYVELMLNTPREHSLWVEDVVEKYSFLKELDDE